MKAIDVNHTDDWPGIRILVLFLMVYTLLHYLFFHGFFWGFLGSYERLDDLLGQYFSISIPGIRNQPFHGVSLSFSGLMHPISAAIFVLFILPLIRFRRKLGWQLISYYPYVRTIVLVAAFVLCWELVTYNYNYYLDSAFYIDRVLLFLLLVGSWFHPVFVPFFTVVALLYRAQFNYPIEGFVLLDKQVLFDVLILFTCFLWFQVIRRLPSSFYLWIVLCLIGSNYFYPLLGKLIISPHGYEWLINNDLGNLFAHANARGWLGYLEPASVESIVRWLSTWSVPLQLITLLLEGLGLFLLWSRKSTWLILLGLIGMHLMVFAFSGILFWKWMVIDGVLALLVYKMPEGLSTSLFSRSRFPIALVVIAAAWFYFKPIPVSWFDTPMVQYFTYEVEDHRGRRYALSKNTFNPYHQLFNYDNRFLYLVDKPTTNITFLGYAYRWELFDGVTGAGKQGIASYLLKEGRIRYDRDKVAAYDEFIRVFFQHYNQRNEKHVGFLSWLKAPDHLYHTKQEELPQETKVNKLYVYYNVRYVEENRSHLMQRDTVHTTVIYN